MPFTSGQDAQSSFDQASGFTVEYAGSQSNIIGGVTNGLNTHKGFGAIAPTTISSIVEAFEVDAPTFVQSVYPVDLANPTKTITYTEE